jgi:polysaccharide biosynthesis transport protein
MSNERVELERVAPASPETLKRYGYPRGAYYPDAYGDGYGEGFEESDGANTLAELWRAIRKHKLLISALTIVVTFVVALELSRIRPTYSAYTILEIRKDTPTVLSPGPDSDPENLININTKMLMFQSRPLLEEIVEKLKLDQNRVFLDVSQKRTWGEAIKRIPGSWLGVSRPAKADTVSEAAAETPVSTATPSDKPEEADGSATPRNSENMRLDRYVTILERGLNVSHIKETQALKVSFTHNDAEIAKAVANGVADSFMRRNLETKLDKFTNTSSWLDHSTNELKAKVRKAEQAMADYTRDHNIFSAQGQQTLTSDKLMRLHDQSTRTEIDLLLKQSLFEEVSRGNLDRLPEVFSDPKIGDLQRKLNELSVSSAQLTVSFGPENPKVQEVQQQMAVLQRQLDATRGALQEKLRTDYERAQRDNQSLKVALDRAKADAAQQDQAAVQYNILKQDVDTARALYTEFLQKTNQVNLEAAQQRNNIYVIQPAQMPKSPDGPNKPLIVLMGFALSLAGAIGLAFVLERFDTTIRSVTDINRYAQLPTLGVIPSVATTKRRLLGYRSNGKKNGKRLMIMGYGSSNQSGSGSNGFHPRFLSRADSNKKTVLTNGKQPESEKVTVLDNWSSVAEAYRALRTSVLLSTEGGPPKTILITSGQPGEGKTTTVINTAVSIAQLGASVLIIDADLRKPAAHKGFGVKPAHGLSSCLASEAKIEDCIHKLQTPNLSLLPCGPLPSNPAELIGSERMKELLRVLSERYDHILIDSPPLMYVTDPVILSTIVDGVILVVRGGKSDREAVFQSRLMLSSVGAKVFGVVLNDVRLSREVQPELTYSPNLEDLHQREEEGVSDILLG